MRFALSPSLAMGTARRYDSFGAVYRRARKHGHAGVVQALPYSGGDGEGGDAGTDRNLIRTTGFFNNKAKSIKVPRHRIIVDRFGGKVPETLAELITVPGAARKTANVVLGVSYGKAEGVVVDTHVFRIAHRLDLTKSDTAEKVEQDLMRILPKDHWIRFSHQVIHHGRQVCIARNPKCDKCNLEQLCHSKDKTWWS